MRNVIYKVTNLVNNKIYIGLTTQGLLQRKREHYSRLNSGNRDHKFYLAMKKYGFENFKFEELFCCFDKEDLAYYEIQFIKEYNSFNRGYNMTIGGDTVSDETRKKLSEKSKGRKITWYNKILESRKSNKSDKRQKFHSLMNSFGSVFEVWNLKAFCDEHVIDPSNLYNRSKSDKFTKGYLLLQSSTTSLTA